MDQTEMMPEVVQPTRRRRHSKEFKAEVIRAAMQPNVSIAAVSLHYRLNANMLRSWVAAQGSSRGRTASPRDICGIVVEMAVAPPAKGALKRHAPREYIEYSLRRIPCARPFWRPAQARN